ncbi:MAG: FemAB family PEP-CTERM system-associated protein [Gammaproteobacteria bacterium]|nr:FemAB family PEP-CTERM system-associated protein [Gammaproteobacteria bacterium]
MDPAATHNAAAVTSGSGPEITVRTLTPDYREQWDEFVDTCPNATFFHRAGWQEVIEKAFGHRTHYLFAERNGRIAGVLPLGHIRSRLFGNALISTPFCMYGGIATEDSEVFSVLESTACALAERLKVDYLEMRNREARHTGWPAKELYVTFRKSIDSDPEKNLLAIPRKQRAMVRKGIKAGLKGEFDSSINRFYEAYSQSVRNLGTPVFSRGYIKLLLDVFRDSCDILTVTHDGDLVSSVLSFYFRDEVLPFYGGGTPLARQLKGNDFMYWELMRHSCERGLRVFDYGRSKQGTGSFNFKKNWGFEPTPLHYEYHLVKAREIPDKSPMNPKYRLFINAWKRLPLPVTRLLGPLLVRNLG